MGGAGGAIGWEGYEWRVGADGGLGLEEVNDGAVRTGLEAEAEFVRAVGEIILM